MPSYNTRQPTKNRPPSKTKGALGLFFNPALGSSFATLKETGRMFIHLIALIFAQADLIDKRHPAVTGKERYSLTDIISLAYERVEWRQENLAQISLFLAVCAALGICALGAVYAVFAAIFSVT